MPATATAVVIGARKSYADHPPHYQVVAVVKLENRVEFRPSGKMEDKGDCKGGDCK